MKTLGISNEDGSYIVSMSKNEYHEFIRLEQAVANKSYVSAFYPTLQGVDLSPIFMALGDLATAKHSITELQSYINNLANYFGKVSSVSGGKDG